MPKFTLELAFSVPCYLSHEVEAENLEAAKALIDEAFDEAEVKVMWDGADDYRCCQITDEAGNRVSDGFDWPPGEEQEVADAPQTPEAP